MRSACVLLVVSAIVAAGCGHSPHLDATQEERFWQLRSLVSRGDVSRLRELLWQHPPLARYADDAGETLLHEAAMDDKPAAIACIMKAGADVNAVNKYGETPLFCAVRSNKAAAVHALLEHGADTEIVSEVGMTPLMAAAYRGFVNILEMLVSAGAELDRVDGGGKLLAASFGKRTALFFAVEYGQVQTAAALLARGANVNARDALQYTPLYEAMRPLRSEGIPKEHQKQIDVVNVLLAAGADPRLPTIMRDTPLDVAESPECREQAPRIAAAVREAAYKRRSP